MFSRLTCRHINRNYANKTPITDLDAIDVVIFLLDDFVF